MRCGHCGFVQPSPIFVGDTKIFDTLVTAGNVTNCGKCGKMINMNKENMAYVLADGSGGAVYNDFGGNKAS